MYASSKDTVYGHAARVLCMHAARVLHVYGHAARIHVYRNAPGTNVSHIGLLQISWK